MVHAVANSVVPKFTVIIGGSFGAGNYGMCGRAYEPRLLWMWPNARISVMGGEQARGRARPPSSAISSRAGEISLSETEDAAIRDPIIASTSARARPITPPHGLCERWDSGSGDDARRAGVGRL